MTESLYFEADSHRSLELDTLSAKLGIRVENLLTESLEMLLASYRQSQSGAEPIGLVADLHGGQGRIRTMGGPGGHCKLPPQNRRPRLD
jgi:hypothetical protein